MAYWYSCSSVIQISRFPSIKSHHIRRWGKNLLAECCKHTPSMKLAALNLSISMQLEENLQAHPKDHLGWYGFTLGPPLFCSKYRFEARALILKISAALDNYLDSWIVIYILISLGKFSWLAKEDWLVVLTWPSLKHFFSVPITFHNSAASQSHSSGCVGKVPPWCSNRTELFTNPCPNKSFANTINNNRECQGFPLWWAHG